MMKVIFYFNSVMSNEQIFILKTLAKTFFVFLFTSVICIKMTIVTFLIITVISVENLLDK